MPTPAPGPRLNEAGPSARPCASHRFAHRPSNAVQIIPIYVRAGNAVSGRPGGARACYVARSCLRDVPAIVLADVDDGQPPTRGQVDCLVNIAAIGRPVTKRTHAHALAAFLLERECRARCSADRR